MPQFSYRVRTPGGGILSGTLEAPEQRAVVDRLRGQKYIILDISQAKANLFLDTLKLLNPFRPFIKSRDLVLFSRQLSTLVSAGVPLVQGLNILIEQTENPPFRKVIEAVREDIEAGLAIAESLKKHPEAFSELYISMVRAGEVGGILDVILERLSAYLEAAEALRSKVKGAMVYPAVVLTVAAGVTLFLLIVVIPTFRQIFESFGSQLPLPTRILIAFSDFLRRFILLLVAGLIGGLIAFRQWRKTEKGRSLVDARLLKLPLFGSLFRKVAIAKVTRTLGTLVKSGVPILQALDTVAKTAGNVVVENAIHQARESIREGERIADPLRKSGVFPPMVIQMIAVGEETGNLDGMLAKIADFYDLEVDTAIKALTSMIEPVIIVAMGLVIGAIVIAMFMPIFELGQLASRAG
ncbi:MAG: type II secretion system F family protein [Elusimicrobia bacterium]|nr:type II secretion system F family protein [Elusimicrobiota bacterium]